MRGVYQATMDVSRVILASHQLDGSINLARGIKRHSGKDQLCEIWSRWLLLTKWGAGLEL